MQPTHDSVMILLEFTQQDGFQHALSSILRRFNFFRNHPERRARYKRQLLESPFSCSSLSPLRHKRKMRSLSFTLSVLLVFVAVRAVPSQPSGVPTCTYSCPQVDQAGSSLGNNFDYGEIVFCTYPAFASECDYSAVSLQRIYMFRLTHAKLNLTVWRPTCGRQQPWLLSLDGGVGHPGRCPTPSTGVRGPT